MALLDSRSLHVRIGEVTVCDALDLQVEAGERWCVLGRNGAGKTTLLHTLAGLRRPDSGSIHLDSDPLQALAGRTLAQRLGILFQDHHDAFPASVLETVLCGRHPWLSPLQWESNDDRQIALAALRNVGLEHMASRNVATLSGGERRRVGIATLLAQSPRLMLLDEPTNHLDIHHQVAMLEHLQQRAVNQHRGLVMVLHDINLAKRFCNRFLLLSGNGDTVSGDAATVLTRDNLERAYGHPLTRISDSNGEAWIPG